MSYDKLFYADERVSFPLSCIISTLNKNTMNEWRLGNKAEIPFEDIIITYRHMDMNDSKVVQTDFVPQLALFCFCSEHVSLSCSDTLPNIKYCIVV